MNSKPFHGLIAAPFTPFHRDGSLDCGKIPAYARHLADNGIIAVFICGTTGEGASLTTSERKKVAETWMKHSPAGLRIIVHVGHTALGEARDLAAHAESIGANAISAAAPSFFKPTDASALAECCAEIAAAAPETPFYYYQIPSMTGVCIPCLDFLEAADGRIPTLRGIKYTYEDLMDYLSCLRFQEGKYDIVFGRDESLAAALAIGAKGAIGSTYNYLAPVFKKLLAAFGDGDLESAADFQYKANETIRFMIRHGGLPAAKAIMKIQGFDLGSVRLPLTPLPRDQMISLSACLGMPSMVAAGSR